MFDFHKLDSISKRVIGVKPVIAGEWLVFGDVVAALLKASCQPTKVIHNEGRMRFASRNELGVHSQVDLQQAILEPAASPASEVRRFVDFGNAQHDCIEHPVLIFPPGWHRELDVVDTENWHCATLALYA
jgi:hypothetical protein